MQPIARRRMLALGASAVLSACSLPRGAANQKQILKSAEDDVSSDYAIYPVTKTFLPSVAKWPSTGRAPYGGWISGGGGRRGPVISAGDTLELTIWDNAEASLLTPQGQKAVPLSSVPVAPDGHIFVPYLDRVSVAGLSQEAARMRIQEKLADISPSAQVQLRLTTGRSNSVDLVGGAKNPGNFPMSEGGLSVLNLIALGGGVSADLKRPVVRLSRGGKMHVTTLERLYQEPGLDTALRGGDKVILESDTRQFIALGAAGVEQAVVFPTERPSALEAVAAVGGVNDSRADPKAVLILREYAAKSVRDGVSGPGAQRVIFTIDLTTADGLFSAGKFHINPDDVIYVTESPLTGFRTVASVIGTIFSLGSEASSAAN